MSQELIIAVFGLLVPIIVAFIAGDANGRRSAIVSYDRAMQSVLGSPVIMKALDGAFASLPAPVQQAAKDTEKVIEEIVNSTPATPAASVTVTVPPAGGAVG